MKPILLNYTNGAKTGDRIIVTRLIYLWAFIESGLGGVLHLLHIPLTGFIIGGFAVIINVLLAKFGNNKPKIFIEALGVVLAVKFFLSPYSPIGAYVAVSFQGFLAALLFSVFGLNAISILVFAVLAMVESGLQKPVLAYLLIGNDFWNAVLTLISDSFSISINKVKSGAVVLAFVYVMSYVVWGVVLSFWANRLQKNIAHLQPERDMLLNIKSRIQVLQIGKEKTKKGSKLVIFWLLTGGFLALMLFFTKLISVVYFTKVLLVLVMAIFIFPLLTRKYLGRLFRNKSEQLSDVSDNMQIIKNKFLVAWNLADSLKGAEKYKCFITYAIWLNVFYE